MIAYQTIEIKEEMMKQIFRQDFRSEMYIFLISLFDHALVVQTGFGCEKELEVSLLEKYNEYIRYICRTVLYL